MSVSVNRVIIAGNLTRDPELRQAGASQVANLGIAVNRRYKTGDGEQREEVTFVDVECWGRTAELVSQYLTKGRACLIEGRLKLDQWEDKESGATRSKMKVVAEQVQFLGGKSDSDSGAAPERQEVVRRDGRRAAPGTASSETLPPAENGAYAGGDDEPPF